MTQKNDTTRQYVTLLFTVIGVVIANIMGYISNTGGTGNVSDTFFADNYLIPAGFIFFTIWTFIYANMLALGIFQALPSQRENPRFRRVSWWFGINMLLNASWVVVFDQTWFLLSLVIIVLMLISAFYIHHGLEIGRQPATGFERWLRIPFSIYTGWLTVATILSITSQLMVWNWNGFGIAPQTWAVIMLLVAGVLGYMLWRVLNDWAYLIPFAYAFMGIAVKYMDIMPLAVTAGVLAVIYVVILGMDATRTHTQQVSATAV